MHIFSKINKYKKHFNVPNYLLLAIIIISIIFRFWKLSEFFTFNFDEEYQALMAWEQVKNFHPIWIGVSASNISYYLGPGITYLNALLFFINKDPVVLGIFGSSFGVLTTILTYWVTKKLFSQKAGLIASIFYAASTFIAFFDRRFWNPTPVAFISLIILYSLMEAKKNSRWLIVSVTMMGIALHVHLSLLAFWPVIIFVVITKMRNHFARPASVKFNFFQPVLIILSALFCFMVVTLPLLIFDINHNYDNLLMPVRFIKKFFSPTGGNSLFLYNLKTFNNTLSHIFWLRPFTSIQDEFGLGVHFLRSQAHFIFTISGYIVLTWLFVKSVKQEKYRILSLSLFSFMIVFLTYSSGGVQYFLLGFIALFFVTLGYFLSRLPNFFSIILIMIFVIANFVVLFTTQQEQYGLKVRKELIEKIMPHIGNNSFYLETRSVDGRKYHSMGGWRYLFIAYGKTPAQSHADDFFGWIYQPEISKDKPKLRVIVSEYPTKVTQKIIFKINKGVYYGYIVNN